MERYWLLLGVFILGFMLGRVIAAVFSDWLFRRGKAKRGRR